MFDWLRKWLKGWLLEETDLTTIEFKIGKEPVKEGRVMAAIGVHLRVLTGQGETLVMDREAVDSTKFWMIWNHLRKDDRIEWDE